MLPLMVSAQSEWEAPVVPVEKKPVKVEKPKKQKNKIDPEDVPYLAGAVSEVDGKVEWKLDVDVPGKTASQIYDKMLKCFTDITRTENQLEGSRVAMVNKKDHIVVATISEWLVFKDQLLALDRTKMNYTLIAYCSDNHLTVTFNRISYKYEEERVKGGLYYKAEDWITDKNALNRKKTKLTANSGKFRRKTVDRKNEIFRIIKETVLR